MACNKSNQASSLYKRDSALPKLRLHASKAEQRGGHVCGVRTASLAASCRPCAKNARDEGGTCGTEAKAHVDGYVCKKAIRKEDVVSGGVSFRCAIALPEASRLPG